MGCVVSAEEPPQFFARTLSISPLQLPEPLLTSLSRSNCLRAPLSARNTTSQFEVAPTVKPRFSPSLKNVPHSIFRSLRSGRPHRCSNTEWKTPGSSTAKPSQQAIEAGCCHQRTKSRTPWLKRRHSARRTITSSFRGGGRPSFAAFVHGWVAWQLFRLDEARHRLWKLSSLLARDIMAHAQNRPKIVIIGIQDRTFLDSQMYKPLRDKLNYLADIRYVGREDICAEVVNQGRFPQAILVVDAGVVLHPEKVARVCDDYLRKGGRLVFAANFANYMPKDYSIRKFFSQFGLFWEFSYVQKDLVVSRNPDYSSSSLFNGCIDGSLPSELTLQETEVLRNVRTRNAVYVIRNPSTRKTSSNVSTDESCAGSAGSLITHMDGWGKKSMGVAQATAIDTQECSSERPPSESNSGFVSTSDEQDSETELLRNMEPPIWTPRVETPVAWAEARNGFVGVVCDHNAQNETMDLLLLMLGLHDPSAS